MKKFSLLAALLLSAVGMTAQSRPKQIELTKEETQLVQSNNDFAFRLFSKTRGTESHVISPLSITYALGMLNNGATGITQQEINTVLGSVDVGSPDIINQFCRKMLTESALLDEDTKVAIANTIYFNGDRNDIALKTPFKDTAAKYYDAEPSVLSFSDPKTLDVINQWVTDRTDGMIKDLVKPADMQIPNLVSFLLNAISFKGTWVNQFDEQLTQYTYFDGMKRTAMMMSQVNEFKYAKTDTYQSVVLPYGNGAYQMTLFLPQWGVPLDDMLAAMNGKNWREADYKTYEVALSMPRIETDTEQDLKEVMKSMGMPNAFLGGAGFDEFCYVGDDERNSDLCWIAMMRQKAHLKLDEKGTEAAAATVIAVADKAMPQYTEFIADRPFIYTISERSTGAIFFIGQYMGEPIENARRDIELTKDEKLLVENNNDFAFRLMREARTEDSQILSPLSITYALGMLNNGAAGKTQQEINTVLGSVGIGSPDAINQFCRKLLTESATLDTETKVAIANTIFVNNHWDYQLKESFVEKANQFYDATPESRDFYDGVTRDVINQWASDHTEGMIKEPLKENEFNKDAVSYLLNALYFKGTWAEKFKQENTCEEPFNGGNTVPMMHLPGGGPDGAKEFQYTENDLYQAVKLPYGNGAYQMTVYLPRQGKTVADVLAQMSGKNWQVVGHSSIVDLKLPRFETNTDVNLKLIMSALGMPTAFDLDNAEFPDFCNHPTYIGLMKQAAKIKVNEEGTEAAAVTTVGYYTTGMPSYAEFHATRPFLYIISEQSTGAIFFIGQYMGDGTTKIVNVSGNANENGKHIYNLSGQRLMAPPARGLYIQDGRKILK